MFRIATITLLLFTFLFSACKTTTMPCPSYSTKKEDAFQLGGGPEVKYDKNGRIKK
jgi:hypothetical protein